MQVRDHGRIQGVGTRRRDHFRVARIERLVIVQLEAQADIRQGLLILGREGDRTLISAVFQSVLSAKDGGVARIRDRAVRIAGRLVTIVVEIAFEIHHAQTKVELQFVVEEVPAVSDAQLIQFRIGLTITLLQLLTVRTDDGLVVVHTKWIRDMDAIGLQQGHRAGLAVVAAVIGIGETQGVVVVDVPDQ